MAPETKMVHADSNPEILAVVGSATKIDEESDLFFELIVYDLIGSCTTTQEPPKLTLVSSRSRRERGGVRTSAPNIGWKV